MIDDDLQILIDELRELAEGAPPKLARILNEAADRLRQMEEELELTGQEL